MITYTVILQNYGISRLRDSTEMKCLYAQK